MADIEVNKNDLVHISYNKSITLDRYTGLLSNLYRLAWCWTRFC